jgi:hypothetical protein
MHAESKYMNKANLKLSNCQYIMDIMFFQYGENVLFVRFLTHFEIFTSYTLSLFISFKEYIQSS